MKIKLLLSLLLLSSFTFPAVAQWTVLNSGDTLPLNSIAFVNDSTGFIVACDLVACDYPSVWSGGHILKTTDAGNTWDSLQNPQGYARTSISFVNVNIGYVSGPNILKTIDGGITWFHPCPASGFNSKFIYFITDSVGFIHGYPDWTGHTIRRTINGGIDWYDSYFNPSSNISSVFFTSAQAGFAVGHDSALVLKTTDGGANWNVISTMYSLLSVHFPSVNTGYAAGFNGTIIRTNDSGYTWSPQMAGTNANLRSIYCLNDNTCYAVGDSGTILKTTDGGNTWVTQNSGTAQELRSIYCTSNHCYVAGDSGIVLKTEDGEVGIKNVDTNENLVSIFPNPSNDILNIQNNSTLSFRFTLYNSLGEKIIDEILTEKTSRINLSDYSEGIYFYILSSDEKRVKTGKIIKQ